MKTKLLKKAKKNRLWKNAYEIQISYDIDTRYLDKLFALFGITKKTVSISLPRRLCTMLLGFFELMEKYWTNKK
jgi:hypothetical protein